MILKRRKGNLKRSRLKNLLKDPADLLQQPWSRNTRLCHPGETTWFQTPNKKGRKQFELLELLQIKRNYHLTILKITRNLVDRKLL